MGADIYLRNLAECKRNKVIVADAMPPWAACLSSFRSTHGDPERVVGQGRCEHGWTIP